MKQAILIVFLFICTTAVMAQTATDSVKYHFPIVTVTGTRFAEPWLTVPLSISVVEQKDLPKGKGYGLDEALTLIPGVLVQSRFGNQDVRVSIRGFGARGAGERSNAGTSRGVRVLNNGFPDTEPDGRTSFDLIDVSGAGNIEVIRSNASSIYGNASGGVINVVSNTTFKSPYASYTQAFGSFGFRKESLNSGLMVGDGKMYFSMTNTKWDGWRAQSASSQLLVSTGLVSKVGEKTNLGIHLSGTSNIFRIPGPLSQGQYDSNATQSDSLYRARDERRYNRLGRIGVNVSHELDDNNMITSSAFIQPKFIQRSERNTFRDFNRYHVGGNVMYRNSTSSESEIKNVFLLGVDEAYQDGSVLFYKLTPLTGRGDLSENKAEGANNFGAFIQDELSFGKSWSTIVGLRYDNITYYSEGYFSAPAARKSETKSYTHVTPKFGLTYMVSSTHSLYANLGGGVEVPAGNETDPSGTVPGDSVNAINPLLDPITSTTLEVGTKQVLPIGDDAHLTYDVAAYWLQVNDDIIPYRNGRFYFTAGRTQRMGLEMSGNIQFTNGLSASVALTASSNKYKEYRIDSVHYSASKAGIYADYADNKVVGIPDVFYTISLKYAPEMLQGVYAQASLQSIGKYYADDANKIEVPSYAVLNIGIGVNHFNFADDKLYVNAFIGVNNVTDAKYIGSAWLNPDYLAGRAVYIEPSLPANFIGSIGLGVNF